MTATLLLANLFAWSAQVAIVVATAALAAMTLAHPRARLLFWQGILAIALLLPIAEPWRQPPPERPEPAAIASPNTPVYHVHRQAGGFQWRNEYILVLIAGVSGLRLVWIAAGLVRLRRHVLDAQMLTVPPVPFSNPRVRWFLSSTIGGPVTFGFLNPTILLPLGVAALPGDLKEAIAHHELAHVRRRDWLFVLLEEVVRSLLWFHPAVWFVLSRIQLAREQVVDAEVVGLTRDRERYLDALVAVAAQKIVPDVAPAPLFLKKRQLAQRVAAVLKETHMSRSRVLLNLTAVCSSAAFAACLAVWMFPLEAPAQSQTTVTAQRTSTVADGPGVVVEPGAKILHRSPVFYPNGATETGTVIVDATVNQKGEVTDARIVSGPDELRAVVLASVLNWHFSTDQGLSQTVQSIVRFTLGPSSAPVTASDPVRVATISTPPTIKSINTATLPDELAQKVNAALPVHLGDEFGPAERAKVNAAVKEIDEHLFVASGVAFDGVNLIVMLPKDVPREPKDAVPAEISGPMPIPQRIRVGGNVQAYNLIKKVTPAYPPLAKQARIQGTVSFAVIIDKQGTIENLELISGHPLLVEAARDAVAQWQYKPTLLNGSPVEVITQVDVNFTLAE